jgi:hypothetical protein
MPLRHRTASNSHPSRRTTHRSTLFSSGGHLTGSARGAPGIQQRTVSACRRILITAELRFDDRPEKAMDQVEIDVSGIAINALVEQTRVGVRVAVKSLPVSHGGNHQRRPLADEHLPQRPVDALEILQHLPLSVLGAVPTP